MTTLVSEHHSEPWRRRMFLPNYHVGEAARYAQISPQTVAAWHRIEHPTLSHKERRVSLSYMQLIEVAVVAAFRKAGISLKRIRDARHYVRQQLKTEYPFAQYKFKTEGKHLLIDYQEIEGERGSGKHIVADQGGQLEWNEIIGPLLKEFEYEHEGIVIRWHVAGPSSPVVIDPRLSFGAPTVRGTPTWVIGGRWNAGESVSDIAEDFGLEKTAVKKALEFEGLGSRKRGKPSRVLVH
jgi:uncharacterized protein (DUF433 family)